MEHGASCSMEAGSTPVGELSSRMLPLVAAVQSLSHV